MSDERLVLAMFIRPSRLAPEVFVPFEVLETTMYVSLHSGPREAVMAFCEQYAREQHEQYERESAREEPDYVSRPFKFRWQEQGAGAALMTN